MSWQKANRRSPNADQMSAPSTEFVQKQSSKTKIRFDSCRMNFLVKKHKKSILAILVIAWLVMLLIGFARQPRSGQVEMNYSTMQEDMKHLLRNGGKVVDSTDLVKPGRARVSRIIDVEGWSDSLLKKYQIALREKGWSQLNATDFCKQGILAKVIANAGMQNGREINWISMEFDSLTPEKCAKPPTK
jgi:hypothetical protein